MSFSNRVTNTIQDFPNEILYRILDLCRPDNFETAVLACKTFYAAARPLILWHNTCKLRLRDPAMEKTTTGHVAIRDIFAFLEWLLTLRAHNQVDQFRYFKRVHMLPDMNPSPLDSQAVIDRMVNKFPHLHTVISHVGSELWRVTDVTDREAFSDISELEDYDENESVHFTNPSPVYYELVILCLFINLESLAMDGAYLRDCRYSLLDVLSRNEDHIIFYRLRELYITGRIYIRYAQLSQVLRLPHLRLLMLEEFNQPFPPDDETEGTETEDPLSSIETLAILHAGWQPQSIQRIIIQSPRLHTFIWEDYTYLRADGRDDDEEFSVAGQIAMNTDYGQPSDQFESMDNSPWEDEELDVHCSLGERMGWPWAAGQEPPQMFKPSILLEMLAKTHGDKLERLAITLNSGSDHAIGDGIQRRFKILHFLDFKILTHLEFDMKLLRNRKGDHFGFPSLTKVLPRSLKALSIVTWAVTHSPLQHLLGSLPAAKPEYPHLRMVFIHYKTFDTFSGENKTRSIITGLREQFSQVGVTLNWDLLHYHQSVQYSWLSWEGITNVLDSIRESRFP